VAIVENLVLISRNFCVSTLHAHTATGKHLTGLQLTAQLPLRYNLNVEVVYYYPSLCIHERVIVVVLFVCLSVCVQWISKVASLQQSK